MKIRFTRTPPKEYSAYVEGEETENLSETEARYLVTLGFAALVRESEGASTQHVSSRTEIVGDGVEVAAVLTGRGANITKIEDPKAAELPLPGEVSDTSVASSTRLAASQAEAVGLVRQEASRQGGVVDESSTKLPSEDENDKAVEGEQKAQTAAEREKAAKAKKASGAAPENK